MSTKRRLALLPEVLPAPTAPLSAHRSVRGRTIARLKVLAAIGAAGLGGQACDGIGPYTVVDPLPTPSCPRVTPTLHAAYIEAPLDGGVDSGTIELPLRKLVELTVDSSDPAIAINAIATNTDARLTIVERSTTATGIRAVVRAPIGEYDLTVETTCSQGTNRGDFEIHLTLTSAEVTVATK